MGARSKFVTPLVVAAVTITMSLMLFGCKSKTTADSSDNTLTVLCGSSFVSPTNKLIEDFTALTGIKISTTVAGSEDFLPQVKVASLGDILITHDPFLNLVDEAGKLQDHAEVGYVAPVLAVQPGNPKNVKSIQDLTQPGLKVGLTDPQYSTAGEMVFALLDKKGIKDKVLTNVGNRLTKGHTDLANLIKTQTVDAGIIWNGVAHTFKDSVEMVPTPYEYDNEIQVHVMSLNYSRHPAEVAKFMDYVKENGPAVFAEYGYVK